MPSDLRISRSLSIPLHELEWHFSASGGPGGQHANRSNTRVELRFDIAGSAALGPRQRARLIERIGPTLRIVSDEERSQLRNREAALERLRARLADALRIERPRNPTTPTQASIARRVEAKRRRSQLKRLRERPTDGAE